MYDTIVVPTDGSEGAAAAAEHAVDIAGRYDATLHALYVVDVGALSYGSAGVEVGAIETGMREAGAAAVADVAEVTEAAGVECVTEVVEGVPHAAIVEYAEDRDADLLVMGTHGRTGIDRLLLGSVAEKVVRSSDVPVLTVRTPAD